MTVTAPLNLGDYEALAKDRMHPGVWDVVVAGAVDEITVAENRRAFDRRHRPSPDAMRGG
jgi:hypothetical protein